MKAKLLDPALIPARQPTDLNSQVDWAKWNRRKNRWRYWRCCRPSCSISQNLKRQYEGKGMRTCTLVHCNLRNPRKALPLPFGAALSASA